jgi:hypothetical protein
MYSFPFFSVIIVFQTVGDKEILCNMEEHIKAIRAE